MPIKRLEAGIEKAVVEYARRRGAMAIKLSTPVAGYAGHSSLPDRLLLFPGGRVAFMEFKRPGGKPTPRQLAKHSELIALGFDVYVIDDAAQGKSTVNDYL